MLDPLELELLLMAMSYHVSVGNQIHVLSLLTAEPSLQLQDPFYKQNTKKAATIKPQKQPQTPKQNLKFAKWKLSVSFWKPEW